MKIPVRERTGLNLDTTLLKTSFGLSDQGRFVNEYSNNPQTHMISLIND